MPAPGNDNFTSATNLDLTGALPASLSGQTTFDATKEATEPAFATNDQSVWYRVQPTVTGWYKFWVDDDEQIDHPSRGLCIALSPATTLAGFTTASVISRVDNPESFSPSGDWTVAGYLTSGSTYHIKVYASRPSSINQQTFDFTIRWDTFTPPANDNMANAIALTLGSPVTVDTYNCTYETGEGLISPGFYTGMQGQWYTITTSGAGWYTAVLSRDDIEFTGDATPAPPSYIPGYMYIQAFAASVDTVAEATEANDLAVNSISVNGTGDTSLQFQVPSAGTYYIRVATPYNLISTGDGIRYCFNNGSASTTLIVDDLPPPANDDYANAEVVTTSPIVGTTYAATEEAGEGAGYSGIDQGVWYEWSPPSDGHYVFSLDEANVTMHGAGTSLQYEVYFGLWDSAVATSAATTDAAGTWGGSYNYGVVQYGSDYSAVLYENLLAANTYIIKVSSRMSSSFNQRTADFEIDFEEVFGPDNDDFADAEAISGSIGDTTGSLLVSTVEVDEPESYYWNGPPQPYGTVWYDWTCPTTGNYVFKVQCTNPGDAQNISPYYDLAVWQGASLATLTKVCRNLYGSQNTTGVRANQGATAVGFHGTSGQHYMIQVSAWEDYIVTAPDHELSWRTDEVTGNTPATALAFPDGRIDNYGNDETFPPPDYVTTLSAHDSWWFDNGQVGYTKWFKREFGGPEVIEIRGKQYDESVYGTNVMTTGDIGLIAYKGADYASLVVADDVTAGKAAMMIENTAFLPYPISLSVRASFTNVGPTRDYVSVDCDAGDTLWICVFGMYDDAVWAVDPSPEDASQFELDLHVPTPPPGNDIWNDVWESDTWQWDLRKGKYPLPNGDFTYAYAVGREGSTIGASAEVGEDAHAGFTATRSVWYYMDNFDYDDDVIEWTLRVESPVDCVLSIYDIPNSFTGETGDLLMEDDNSGAGDNPSVTFTGQSLYQLTDEMGGWGYAVAIDSKTEGPFDLILERTMTGTPPANDNFADAEVHTGGAWSASGQTTVDATAEPFEPNNYNLGEGPKDSVWYKWTPDYTGHASLWCNNVSDNDDAEVALDVWQGDELRDLTRVPNTPDNDLGYFWYGDTDAENRERAVRIDVTSGQDYYIRVQTYSGGSEDFEIHVDETEIFINIQVTHVEEMHGTLLDEAEIFVHIQTSSVEDFHQVIALDADTAYVNIQPGGSEFPAIQYSDASTVRVSFTIDSHDCQTKFDSSQLIAHPFERFEHIANYRWVGTLVADRFEVVAGDGLEEC